MRATLKLESNHGRRGGVRTIGWTAFRVVSIYGERPGARVTY